MLGLSSCGLWATSVILWAALPTQTDGGGNKDQEEKAVRVRMMERGRGLLSHTGWLGKASLIKKHWNREPSHVMRQVMKTHEENSRGRHDAPRL